VISSPIGHGEHVTAPPSVDGGRSGKEDLGFHDISWRSHLRGENLWVAELLRRESGDGVASEIIDVGWNFDVQATSASKVPPVDEEIDCRVR